ncbi:Rhodanese-like domain protein [Labilithrix luteola]|uniref:Rhodanese-like domain protein n=1 Tax=Labilithrix luteola TaxID=1391654 RepID=A0A0K1PX36_9BACT|nr:rhodanese-like domain-containing protein [Labilithrix luteola]AKU97941.1 Rhodanese-like domain protein [Labilithrix luteola]
MQNDVLTIARDELRDKLRRHDDFKLVMSLNEWAFQQKHIRGSIHFNTPDDMLRGLRKDEEIIVYCSNVACKASINAYHLLVDNGYTRVRRYADGLSDWEVAGLPLEGNWIKGDVEEQQ